MMSTRVMVLSFVLLGGAFACSGTGDAGEGAADGGAASDGTCAQCAAVCDAEAAGCPASGADYAAKCKSLTSTLVPAKCASLYDRYATCEIPVGFKCSANVTIDGKPGPESKDSKKCIDEATAFGKCLTAK